MNIRTDQHPWSQLPVPVINTYVYTVQVINTYQFMLLTHVIIRLLPVINSYVPLHVINTHLACDCPLQRGDRL